MFLGLLVVVVTAGVVLATESSESELDALFESTSAFATVGLTVGVTSMADNLAKVMLIIAMFLGRVGPVSFAVSISVAAGTRDKKQIIPEAKVWVG